MRALLVGKFLTISSGGASGGCRHATRAHYTVKREVRRFGGSPFVLGQSTIYVVHSIPYINTHLGNRAKLGNSISIMKSLRCRTVGAVCWQSVLAALEMAPCWG